jgi:hypothetical protein
MTMIGDQRTLYEAYVSRLTVGEPIPDAELKETLAKFLIPSSYRERVIQDLVQFGFVKRNDDGTYTRLSSDPAPVAQPDPVLPDGTPGDNPEFPAFRASVRQLVDERVRELGLIA